MTAPRQVVVILDLAPSALTEEEVKAHLPGGAESESPQVTFLRLAGGERAVLRGSPPSGWLPFADDVARLARDVQAQVRPDEPADLYVCGQAPLPLFVVLGQALATWRGAITVLERRADSWHEVPLSPPQREEEPKFFDVRRGLDALEEAQGRAVVFISSRGMAPEPERLQAFFARRGEAQGAVVEVRTSKHRALEGGSVAQAARALDQVFRNLSAAAAPLLFVQGSPALAFLVGRALGQRLALLGDSLAAPDGAALPLPVVPAERSVHRPPVRVFIAAEEDQPDEPRIAQKLASHLRLSERPDLILFDRDSVPAGERRIEALEDLLTKSDIVVPLLSAELLSSELGALVTRLAGQGRAMVPALSRNFDIKGTQWRGDQLLPRDGRPLHGHGSQDAALAEIAGAVRTRAEEIAQQQRITAVRQTSQRLPDAREVTGKSAVDQVLAKIARDLQAQPLLRFTAQTRYWIWQRLVKHLEQAHPEARLAALLAAPTREHLEEMRRFNPEWPEPERLLPSEVMAPLERVLQLLDEAARAWWLYLGIVFVGPVVAFPEGSAQHHAVSLAALLHEPLLQRLDEQDPTARRQIALATQLHQAGCSGLLATFLGPHAFAAEESALALEILRHLRDHQPLRAELPDPVTLQSAALLNLCGALALWQGDLERAQRAYRGALDRALMDQDTLAEWVAVQGLRFSPQAADWAAASMEDEARQWEQKLALEAQSPRVRAIEENTKAVLYQAQRELAGALSETLANDRGSESPAFGVNDTDLEILLLDQEELGLPPARCGETAELLGTVRLLQSSLPEPGRLADSVALLCRYGSSGLGGRFAKLRFYSPALRPERPEFLSVCQQVLRPGRTVNEGTAKLAFLQRYHRDLPLSLTTEARAFYAASLDTILRQAPRSRPGWLLQQAGASIGSQAEWAAIAPVVEEQLRVAAYLPQGLDWLVELLTRPEPGCWLRVLENLYQWPWKEKLGLGHLQRAGLESLGTIIQRRLAGPESQTLFTGAQPGGIDLIRAEAIPRGVARVLATLQSAGVDAPLLHALHQQLHRMLRHLLERRPHHDVTPFQRALFSEEVWGWLCSQTDDETQALLTAQLDALLADLESFRTVSSYFDLFGLLNRRVLPRLSPAQRIRLIGVLEQHRRYLEEAVAKVEYAAFPLAWFAASLLQQQEVALHGPALDLIAHCGPWPKVLRPLMSLPAQQLDELPIAEGALLHCLLGSTSGPMPWLNDEILRRPETEESALVSAGLNGVDTYLYFHSAREPRSGWSAWLEPVLAHAYHPSPEIAAQAVLILNRALALPPTAIDLVRATHALCWALGQQDQRVRNTALLVARRHQTRLEGCSAGSRLAALLRQLDPPQTLAAAWCWELARLPTEFD